MEHVRMMNAAARNDLKVFDGNTPDGQDVAGHKGFELEDAISLANDLQVFTDISTECAVNAECGNPDDLNKLVVMLTLIQSTVAKLASGLEECGEHFAAAAV